jgi:hypothetical protein
MMNDKIKQLQQELYSTLKQAERNRRKIRVARVLCYGGAMVYFVGMICLQIFVFSGHGLLLINNYELNPNPTFLEQNRILVLIIPLFVLITLGGWGIGYFYRKYTDTEQNAIRRITREMFPGTRCSLASSALSMSLMQQSNFFSGLQSKNASGYSFGTITFENNGRELTFHDIVINKGVQENWLSRSSGGGLFLMAKILYKGLFASRVENVASSFRGMFAEARLEKKINGTVVILPDHLESRLDYLAKNIQALKNVNGNKLVSLEDPEFERYFAVYSNDEITARYVLTPAMMSRMNGLKREYNRDIMLSFSGDRFFFAVAMPEGFLTLGNASLASGDALQDLYDNFTAAREILNNLKIK